MPTMRMVNGFTILAIIPEAATLAREFGDGEMGHTGRGYVIVADDGVQSVVAVMLNPLTDDQWIHGDYGYFDTDPAIRRTKAMIAAIKRSGLDRFVGQDWIQGSLAALFGDKQ